jgi:hypothetical protein
LLEVLRRYPHLPEVSCCCWRCSAATLTFRRCAALPRRRSATSNSRLGSEAGRGGDTNPNPTQTAGCFQRWWSVANRRHTTGPREDGLAHSADTSRSNLASPLAVLSRRLSKPNTSLPTASGRRPDVYVPGHAVCCGGVQGVARLRSDGVCHLDGVVHWCLSGPCALSDPVDSSSR